MRSVLLSAFLLLCAAATTAAQSLWMSDIDTSGFPLLQAGIYAFDANGEQFRPSASELTLEENGVPRSILSVTCPPATAPQALSSVLVVDVSGSMSTQMGGTTRIDLAKAAATAWVNALPLGTNECAIASFDDRNYLNQDFTTNRATLLAAVSALQPQGGTDYDQGLLLPVAGGLQVSTRGKHRRVIVFLTDGFGTTPQTAAIIAEAQRQNCIIYAVTLGMACPQPLQEISTQTGGNWFENVTTVADAERVYRQILNQAQGGLPCQITWQSDVACMAERRDVKVSWNGQTARAGYTVPGRVVPAVAMVPASIYARSKQVAQQFDTTVTITAVNYPTTVTGITSSNPAFDITPKSFTLAVGESRTLTVIYTPPDSSYHWTQFEIRTDRCPRYYFASGGYPGVQPVLPTIRLDDPNGGETFVAGNDTVITWSGIPLSDTVTLEYSTDQGNSWKIITTKAVGGSYSWHIPNTPSTQCLVRVTQTDPNGDGWARQIDSSAYADHGRMVVDGAGNIYVTGSFQLTTNFWEKTLTSVGSRDIYLAKYTPDGKLDWIRRDGGTAYEEPFDIALDSMGNVYVIGEMLRGSSTFNETTLAKADSIDFFLAKYHVADGSFEWVRRARGPYTERGLAVAVDAAGNPYVCIGFNGTLDFGTVQLTSSGTGKNLVIAKYHPDGSLEWARNTGASSDYYGFDSGNNLAVDAAGNAFITGYFSGSIDVGGIPLTAAGSKGSDDVFLAKYRADGSVEWATRAGGDSYDEGNAITIDAAGNIYLVGNCRGTAYFGSYAITSSSSLPDAFIARYLPDGTVDWVRAGDGGGTTGYAVTLDPQGNVYAAGAFSHFTTFGTVKLYARASGLSSSDAFVVKYAPDGTFKWVKRAGGEGSDNADDIDADGAGNIYVLGGSSQFADFDGDTLTGYYNNVDFLWKLYEGYLQSDTSDALFSIVQPQPLGQNVDLGKVLVGATKDSVVQTFITNTGSYPFTVNDILITGTDASQFSLVSGIPPFDVPAGGSYAVEFRFQPTSTGFSSAQIDITTQSETLTRSITGQGVAPIVTIISDAIDFGQVLVGDRKDSLRVVTLVNIGTAPVVVSAAYIGGPNDHDFQTLAGGAQTLNPRDILKLDLRFAPSDTGRTSGRLLLDYNGAVAPAIVQLYGEGIRNASVEAASAAIVANEVAAAPGEDVEVSVILDDSVNISQSGATSLTAMLRFNATLLDPIGNTPRGTVNGNERTIPLELPLVPQSGNVLATLRFRAMLGNDTTTTLLLENPGATGGTVAVRARSGVFHLLGVCYDGGARLLNPSGLVKIVAVRPNPITDAAQIEIETIETGRTRIVVMDILGQEVETVYDGELSSGQRILPLNTTALTTGSYYIQMSTPTVRCTHRISIVK